MPPPNRPEMQQLDPAQQLVMLKLNRAQIAAQIPSQEDFDALQEATANAAVAQREAAIERVAALDEAIAGLE